MSAVCVLSCVKATSASAFVEQFVTHHKQSLVNVNDDDTIVSFHLSTKYYTVTLLLRTANELLLGSSSATFNDFDFAQKFRFATFDEFQSESDAVLILIDAGQLTDVNLFTAFVSNALLARHRPSIVAVVDLSTDLKHLASLNQNSAFRDWLCEEQVEYVTMCAVDDDPDAQDVFGYGRVRDVFAAHMWRDLQRTETARTRGARVPLPEEVPDEDEDEVNESVDSQGDVQPQEAPEDSGIDEAELLKFETALNGLSLQKPPQQQRAAGTPSVDDNGDPVVELVGANESFDERKARLAKAEQMMAMFLEGVGLTMDDI